MKGSGLDRLASATPPPAMATTAITAPMIRSVARPDRPGLRGWLDRIGVHAGAGQEQVLPISRCIGACVKFGSVLVVSVMSLSRSADATATGNDETVWRFYRDAIRST